MPGPQRADSVATKARCALTHRSPLKPVSRVRRGMNKSAYLLEDQYDSIERLSHLKFLHTTFYSSLQST
jgi:hypothetical protein